MSSAAACPRFSQNAWRRELCANCFKSKGEHQAPPKRVLAPLPTLSEPKQSILRLGPRSKPRSSVCFPAEESRVIGWDGGDVSSGDEDEGGDVGVEEQPGKPLFPEPSEEDDRQLQTLTRRNTDFNSENVNLLTDKTPPSPAPKPAAGLPRRASAPVVSVTPFGAKENVKIVKIDHGIKIGGDKVDFVKKGEAPKSDVIKGDVIKSDVIKSDVIKSDVIKSDVIKEEHHVKVNVRTEQNHVVNHVTNHVVKVDHVKVENAINERSPRYERRPPLGHESSSPPLTAPALVKQQVRVENTPPPTPEPIDFGEVPSPRLLRHQDSVEMLCDSADPPPFLRHKDSVDLMTSPPASPGLGGKAETRPAPIGKVSSTLTVTLKPPTKDTPRRPRLVEARSSALIRRWTVGERVLIQPRRPVLDAPVIVPLNLQGARMGLEPRELAGQPDGEDASTASEPNNSSGDCKPRYQASSKPDSYSKPESTRAYDKPDSYSKPETNRAYDTPDSGMSYNKIESSLNNNYSKSETCLNYNQPVINYNKPETLYCKTDHCKSESTLNSKPEPLINNYVSSEGDKASPEVEMRVKDQPPTPPSSPLPEDDAPPPPSLPTSPPPALQRPTSLPAVTPRSSFLHGALLGRPQVPAKPASLLASVNRRHTQPASPVATPVPTPPPPKATPTPEDRTPKTENISVVTPPASPLCDLKVAQLHPPVSVLQTPTFADTLAREEGLTPSNKPPLSTPRPKLGSYKKRQAPKPPGQSSAASTPHPTPSSPTEDRTHVRTLSQDSFEELGRRDSLEKSPPGKKGGARFSLRRLLRLGKDERATSPESSASSPSPPGSPCRPEIIHPMNLDGRGVEVVTRVSPSSPTTSGGSGSTTSPTPPGRPRPPPPPPRTLSLATTPTSRPSRPPPPQSASLLHLREKASEAGGSTGDDDAVYANLDSVKRPSKPQRSGSLRESLPDAPSPDESDYETVQFSDGRMSRRRRSAVLGSLEENYGAVVGANHRALAQLLAGLTSLPLPACQTDPLASLGGAGEQRGALGLLQMLQLLGGRETASLVEFKVLSPQDPQLAELGPRVQHLPDEDAPQEATTTVALQACRLLLPSDPKLPSLLESGGLNRAIAYLEMRLWGPELAPSDKEVALQRWLDLERATALQGLAQGGSSRLAVAQEMYITFLVQASALGLAQASTL